jgi:hypothetical protein
VGIEVLGARLLRKDYIVVEGVDDKIEFIGFYIKLGDYKTVRQDSGQKFHIFFRVRFKMVFLENSWLSTFKA